MTDPDTTEPRPDDDVLGHDATDEVEETADADAEENSKPDEDTEGHARLVSDVTIKHDIRPLV